MKQLTVKNQFHSLALSPIVMGSTYFGTTLPQETVFPMLDRYFQLGGNCVDTARVYGQKQVYGPSPSEELIGAYLRRNPGLRSHITLSTKGGHPPVDHMSASRLSQGELTRDLEDSLKNLGTDYVDIYFLHRDDPRISVSEIMPILHRFATQGKVRVLGASNWSCARIEQANQFAVENGLTPFSVSQIQWSLARTTPLGLGDQTLVCMTREEYQWYKENQFPVFCYSSQSKGFFSKVIAQGVEGLGEKVRSRFLTQENLEKLQLVREASQKLGITPAAAVLLYLTHNQVPAAAIIGCSSLAQLEDTMDHCQLEPSFAPYGFDYAPSHVSGIDG